MIANVLYRMYDPDEVLLYVGSTIRGLDRIPEHSAKPWWADIDIITVEHFESEDELRQAEQAAIRGEHPRYNRRTLVARGSKAPAQLRIVGAAEDMSKRSSVGQELWVVTTTSGDVQVWAKTREAALERVRRHVLNRHTTMSEIKRFPVMDDGPMTAEVTVQSDEDIPDDVEMASA